MLKKLIYPAVFFIDDDGITITFPDLPGCISCADTLEEAYDMAKEAMELYLEDYVKDMFTKAPTPTKIQDIHLTSNHYIALIEVETNNIIRKLDHTSVKKTLTIPAWLNDIASKKKLNFSRILQDALIKELG